ncbi:MULTISPECIES: hypothetical protein [unclassified Paraburkholderia]|uniref:hypothetical protein n=1 Tax=unclassified Paraburkholderia TaxID=2615204 RepID=UPI002AB700F3|nr:MULTISPECIES: hypothetical protein [unclassified Paraburkholderia]
MKEGNRQAVADDVLTTAHEQPPAIINAINTKDQKTHFYLLFLASDKGVSAVPVARPLTQR